MVATEAADDPFWPREMPARIGVKIDAPDAETAKGLREAVRFDTPPHDSIDFENGEGDLVLLVRWKESGNQGTLVFGVLGPKGVPLTREVEFPNESYEPYDATGRQVTWRRILGEQPNLFLFAAAATGNARCQEAFLRDVLGRQGSSEDADRLVRELKRADTPGVRAWMAILKGDFAAAEKEGEVAAEPLAEWFFAMAGRRDWSEVPLEKARRMRDCARSMARLPAPPQQEYLAERLLMLAPDDNHKNESAAAFEEAYEAIAGLLERAGDERTLLSLAGSGIPDDLSTRNRLVKVRDAIWTRLSKVRGRAQVSGPLRVAVRVTAKGWLPQRLAIEPLLEERLKAAELEMAPADGTGVEAILLLDYSESHSGDYGVGSTAVAAATMAHLAGKLIDLRRRTVTELSEVGARAASVRIESSDKQDALSQRWTLLDFLNSEGFVRFGDRVRAALEKGQDK